jgi:RNA polymerase sigma-70 factor, ECF subfamily
MTMPVVDVPGPSTNAHLHGFERERPRLTGIACRILRNRADAEDVLQDAWLRWRGVELGQVANTEAFLATMVTRLALDHRRVVVRRREVAWMATLANVADGAGPQHNAEVAESVAEALHVVLTSLSPPERAALVLHEAFDLPYDELAPLLHREQPAVRQLVCRARSHLAAQPSRFSADPTTHSELVRRFRSACRGSDLQSLLESLLIDTVSVD